MANYVDTGKGTTNEEIAAINQQLMNDYKSIEFEYYKINYNL